jgi:hypothetical protein
MHALAPSTLVAPLTKTIAALCHFNPLADVDLPFFVNDFHSKIDFILDRDKDINHIYALAHSPHLLSDGPLGMLYELLFCDCGGSGPLIIMM